PPGNRGNAPAGEGEWPPVGRGDGHELVRGPSGRRPPPGGRSGPAGVRRRHHVRRGGGAAPVDRRHLPAAGCGRTATCLPSSARRRGGVAVEPPALPPDG